MILETLILALLTGLLFKGKIKNFTHVSLRGTAFIWIGLILRYLPVVFALPLLKNAAGAVTPYAPALFILSFALLIIGIGVNLAYWPMWLVFSGIAMNFAVVVANRGYMPVSETCLITAGYDMSKVTSAALDMNHVLMSAQTRLSFLADIIAVPRPYPFPQILSIGDVLMCAGLFCFIVVVMIPGKKKSISGPARS